WNSLSFRNLEEGRRRKGTAEGIARPGENYKRLGRLLRGLRLQHVEEALQGRELPFRRRVELGREDGGRGVPGEKGEELVVHVGEGRLLEQALVDSEHADHRLLDLQGDDGDRLVERG